MKLTTLFSHTALVAVALSLAACGKQPAKEAPAAKAPEAAPAVAPAPAPAAVVGFESVDQKASYGIGYNIGSGLAREGALKVDQTALHAGIADGLAGAKTRVDEAVLQATFAELQQKAAAVAAASAEKQLTAGTEFLAKNKERPEVKTTASGLQYEVIKSGTGPKPKETDTVKVHYHGTLIDGTVFDSSVERGEPVEFPVTGVIPGWIEALQLMSVGDTWKLYISPNLAYGPRPKGKIPGNSVLVFEVQLLGIQ